jgi:hypothetical protein
MVGMPKLIKNYQRTGEKRPFSMDVIRRSSGRRILDNGLGRQTYSVILILWSERDRLSK